MKIWRPLAAASMGVLGAAGTAFAQDASSPGEEVVLDEVVVTAQSREQSLQDVPVAVSAVTAAMLADQGMQKLEDLQTAVPNFTLTETGIGTNMFIRGIGSGINQGFEQSVAMFIDGVHFGRAQQSRSPFLDLERVEVLRGPQSILFGKNAVAGALSLTTARPTRDFTGYAAAAYEYEDQELTVEGAVSGPLSDRMRVRLAGRYRNFDGFVENLRLSRMEPERKDWTLRATFEADLTDNVTASLKLESGKFDVVGRHTESFLNQSPATAGPFTGLTWSTLLRNAFGGDTSVLNAVQDDRRSSNGDYSYNDSDLAALTVDWSLGEYQLRSITAWNKFSYDELCDCDFTGSVMFDATLLEQYRQISQEFRLTSPVGERFDFITGLFWQTSDHDYGDSIRVPANSILVPAVNARSPGAGTLLAATQADRIATVEADVYAVFGQFSWHLGPNWTLQAGGRYTREKKDGFRTLSIFGAGGVPLPAAQAGAAVVYGSLFGITSTNLVALGAVSPTAAALVNRLGTLPVSGSRDEKKFSPDVKLVWDVNDDTMLYASWARGFKSGGFDFRANNRFFYPTMERSFQFEDEEATNTEIGGKFTLAGGRATINVAAYLEEFDDLQISIFDGVLGFNVGNAASAEIRGVEVDGRWRAGSSLTFTGSVALTDFEFKSFRNGQCYFGQAPNVDIDNNGTFELCDYTGKSNQLVADVRASVGVEFEARLSDNMALRTNLDLYYSSEYDAAPTFDPLLVQDAFLQTNLRVALVPESGRWEVALLGRNLSDERYVTYGQDMPLAGSTFGLKSQYAFFDQGRTVALQARFNF